nr:hypothetical protein [Tanacetum cinerariifolium]
MRPLQVKCFTEPIVDIDDESIDGNSNLSRAITNIIGTTHMLELKTHTYYEHGSFDSFTCWKIIPTEVELEDSDTKTICVVDGAPDNGNDGCSIGKIKRKGSCTFKQYWYGSKCLVLCYLESADCAVLIIDDRCGFEAGISKDG